MQTDMANIHKSIIELIGHTPLVEITNIEKLYGLKASILVKLESANPASSAKDRIALAMIDDAEKRQHLGQTVSDFLVNIVRHLPFHPQYLVAKGGITSHDILTHGLEVKVARVMGQAINSVPCIMASRDSRPLPYIIFPGNVGNEQSLKEIYEKLA